MNSIYKYICNKRLLDGQIGILGNNFWFRVLANYGGVTHILYLALNMFSKSVFSIDISHGWTGKDFPSVVFSLNIFGVKIVDTGKVGFDALDKWSDENMKKHKERKAEEERLIKEAKRIGL